MIEFVKGMPSNQIRVTVLETGPAERISISFVQGEHSDDVSLTPLEALAFARVLVAHARISMFGSTGNPVPHLHPALAAAGGGLDMTASALDQFIRGIAGLTGSQIPGTFLAQQKQ